MQIAVPELTDLTREPTTDELFEAITQGSRIPLAEVKRHPHGHVFEAASQRVEKRDPDFDQFTRYP